MSENLEHNVPMPETSPKRGPAAIQRLAEKAGWPECEDEHETLAQAVAVANGFEYVKRDRPGASRWERRRIAEAKRNGS